MYCPEHKVFGSRLIWVWMYWRDVRRETIPLRVWLNPLNYEVSVFWPPSYKSERRRQILTINREGQWVRNRWWRAKQAVKRAFADCGE